MIGKLWWLMLARSVGTGTAEKNVKLAWRLPYLTIASPRGNNQIYKHTARKQRKWLSTHWQPGLKKNPSWATVNPTEDKHQALTHRWNCYAIVVMEYEVWPTVNFKHFLFLMTFFYCSTWQMILKWPHWNTDLSLNSIFCDFRVLPFHIK